MAPHKHPPVHAMLVLHQGCCQSPSETFFSAWNDTLSEKAVTAFKEHIDKRCQQPHFANARAIRNTLDRARLRQATGLFDCRGQTLTMDDLMMIEAGEILASRVFLGGIEAVAGCRVLDGEEDI